MYDLPYFKEVDKQVIVDFMKNNPFALLIGCSSNMPVATQIPFLIEEKEGQLYLQGHIMRNTDHHKAFERNSAALCVFTGAHSYVSASWYSEKRTASTWNYMSVHARGKMHFLGEDDLLKILEKTTALFENNEHSLASFQNLPADYVTKLAKAIIGFEIKVNVLENVFKLSQNRDKESYQTIINELEKSDHDGIKIAEEMKKRSTKLFPTIY
ncbi:MAG TPA: FMN-binding negative transcriptional regulator [Chitinophagaceae bacterium]|jgi:transcriptional regulator|nr:FMN-binding negative transcriptional regulator [Chitinophagaceae bacterium]